MLETNIQYSKLQLQFDDRFSNEDKLSIYMSHYDMFESEENKLLCNVQLMGVSAVFSIIKEFVDIR